MNQCPYIKDCTSYPHKCQNCGRNTGKKDHWIPIQPYPIPYYPNPYPIPMPTEPPWKPTWVYHYEITQEPKKQITK